MTMRSNGKPIIREFGNIKPSTKHTPAGYHNPALQSTEGREPLADVFEDDTSIRIIAEVPTVDKEDIELTCTEQQLIISVNTEIKKYYKEIDLRTTVDPKISKANYKNDVLQVPLTKIKRKEPAGEKIRLN